MILSNDWVRASILDRIGAPIIPDPIPGLVLDAVPRDYRSHTITPDLYAEGTADTLRAQIDAALRAEDARLRRLLPPAPWGHEWRAEIGWVDGFEQMGNVYVLTTELRIRYRLHKIEGA